MEQTNLQFLLDLEAVISDRLENPTADSYTAKLASAGPRHIAQKIGEEGVEVAIAAVSGDEREIIDEASDLIYHLAVLLVSRNLSLRDVATRLAERHAQ